MLNTSFLNLLTNRLWDVRSCWNNFGIQLNVKKSTLEVCSNAYEIHNTALTLAVCIVERLAQQRIRNSALIVKY